MCYICDNDSCDFDFMMELYKETFGEFETPDYDPEVD